MDKFSEITPEQISEIRAMLETRFGLGASKRELGRAIDKRDKIIELLLADVERRVSHG